MNRSEIARAAWARGGDGRRAYQREVLARVEAMAGGKDAAIRRAHEGVRDRFSDPERYPPAALSDQERAEYRFLVERKKFRMNEALAVLGRSDLVRS